MFYFLLIVYIYFLGFIEEIREFLFKKNYQDTEGAKNPRGVNLLVSLHYEDPASLAGSPQGKPLAPLTAPSTDVRVWGETQPTGSNDRPHLRRIF